VPQDKETIAGPQVPPVSLWDLAPVIVLLALFPYLDPQWILTR
jgi:hypothetical protein